MAKVYIDGQSGTTGLQIFDRIASRDDLELLRIDEDKRHDTDERRRFINAADIVFLCLPDEGAREAVALVENPDVCVIDASTAHRTAEGWTYGFAELNAGQRAAIAASKRIANPGCHATGFISVTAPLVQAGILPRDYPLACYSLTGYSGGGKRMIADYEAEGRPVALDAPGIYGLSLRHKHLPEMQKVCGLTQPPVFMPVVDDYYKGMATSIMLHNRLLAGTPTAEEVHACLTKHYAGQRLVSVMPFGANDPVLYANGLAGTNELRVVVCGNEEHTTVTALFDNLGKGASGAAVQNMNIVLGIDETTGLV
ncbi:MAG: N-acetyl-gamma-glutamyl-phosphate reductase [Atopobiaceae bacterium]|jgi:N-acetyl-gamma-glutamyl-phosphate reductase|nr:N-acetyl-gamma-glutamyl-phosphate reductase [Atopobiaceae bacterium]